jgi:hypothetical protein
LRTTFVSVKLETRKIFGDDVEHSIPVFAMYQRIWQMYHGKNSRAVVEDVALCHRLGRLSGAKISDDSLGEICGDVVYDKSQIISDESPEINISHDLPLVSSSKRSLAWLGSPSPLNPVPGSRLLG